MLRFSIHYFFYFATFAIISPFFQSLLKSRGFDESQVGMLQGVFCLAGALCVGPVGRMADKLGRRRDMLAASIFVSAIILIPLAATSNIIVAAILTALFGVAYKSAIPLGDALASLELPDPTSQYGRVRSLGSIGFITTLWIISGSGAMDTSSSRSILYCFLATAALSLPAILLLPDSHRKRRTLAAKANADAGKSPEKSPPADQPSSDSAESTKLPMSFWILIAVVFLSQLGMVAHYSFFTLYLEDVFKIAHPGNLWAIGSLAELPVIFLADKISRKIGVWWMLVLALSAMSLRLFIYAAAPPFMVLCAAQLLHAGTFGLLHTGVVEFISRTVSHVNRATAMTIYMAIGLGAAQFVGSTVGGHVISNFGYRTMYTLHAIVPLVGIVLLVVRRPQLLGSLTKNQTN